MHNYTYYYYYYYYWRDFSANFVSKFMCWNFVSFVLFFLVLMPNLGLAAEGSSAAGIAGGSDMRSALLPPPGIYMWQGLLPAVNRRIY